MLVSRSQNASFLFLWVLFSRPPRKRKKKESGLVIQDLCESMTQHFITSEIASMHKYETQEIEY